MAPALNIIGYFSQFPNCTVVRGMFAARYAFKGGNRVALQNGAIYTLLLGKGRPPATP